MSKCPHCFKKNDFRATRCTHPSGEIVLESAVQKHMKEIGKVNGRDLLLAFLFSWVIISGIVFFIVRFGFDGEVSTSAIAGGVIGLIGAVQGMFGSTCATMTSMIR